jgi:serine/threonine protein kinase
VVHDSADISAIPAFGVRYEIRQQLWLDGPHGGWDAYDRVLHREVVLNIAYHLNDARRMVEKARTLAVLRHPNILPVLDLGITDLGLPFFTTPKIDHEPLDAVLQRLDGNGASGAEPFPLKRVVSVVHDACLAVHYARGRGIVNTDLYPGAILVGPDLQSVIACGWERLPDADQGAGDHSGVRFLGRLAYASPEQVREESTMITPASDVFGLGGVLHLILYATPPNRRAGGGTHHDLLHAIAEARFEPKKPGALRRALHTIGIRRRRSLRHLEQICLKALHGDPARRHRDAGELGNELDSWLGWV